MTSNWQTELNECLADNPVLWDEKSRVKYSSDFSHFSPLLYENVKGYTAECVASPRNEAELNAIIKVAAKYKVPITPRGLGTCNFGQGIPLTGGILLDLSNLNAILEIGEGSIRVEAGAKLGAMEAAAREQGYELPVLPSTFMTSTIAGYVCGGFGGIGSITWGTIWEDFVLGLKVKTISEQPETIVLSGAEEVLPYIHTYGVIGIITELTIRTVPKVNWMQWAVTFEDWDRACEFGLSVAADESVNKRLVSVKEWPLASSFKPLKLSAERHAVLLELDETYEAEFAKNAEAWGGRIEIRWGYDRYHKGLGVSDFSWGHTTLWARKADPTITYHQATMKTDRFIAVMKAIRNDFPEVTNALEFAKRNGELVAFGGPLFTYQGREHLDRLTQAYIDLDVFIEDPHTYDLEAGGRSYPIDKLWDIKRRNDPYELLNQLKLGRPSAGSVQ